MSFAEALCGILAFILANKVLIKDIWLEIAIQDD